KDHPELVSEIEKDLKRVKWYLWHGNVYLALQVLQGIELDIDCFVESASTKKLLKTVEEFHTFITGNQRLIPNYGDRYHYGERILTGFVERRSIRGSARGSLKNNRCAGRSKAFTYFSKCGQKC